MLEECIRSLFAWYPDVIYGFCDISYSPFASEYPSALVFAVPYGRQLTPDTYTEQGFEDGIVMARTRLECILSRLETLLRERGVSYYIPPVAQENETELLAPFSFKYAAMRAGVGWMGRNDVIITERYGPRVRLSAVLIDAPLEYGQPIIESRCPEDCRLCVDICPCKALKGVIWDATKQRADLIDYHRCNRYRSAFIPKLGRKSACGQCLAACPFGTPVTIPEIRFYDDAEDEPLKFAVIIARSGGKYVFCKHRERDTFEVPGGHREPGEDIIDTARRELYEETGAVRYTIEPVCVYSVTFPGGQETFGGLFFAEISEFESELHSEIERIAFFESLPQALTYPHIQPRLIEEAARRGFIR